MTQVVRVRDRGGRQLEVRDPRAATQRLGYVSPTMPQIDEWNAEQAFRLGYAMNVVAYRCVQLRARAGASVPWVSGRRLGDATTINERAALTKLLGPPPGGPAPKLSARKLLRWTFAQKIVTGRRAWEIETDNGKPDGRPVAFWPLAAANLRATPSKGGVEWFRLFEYGSYVEPERFQPGNVFYGWEPSGNDFRQAESEFQAARFDLSLVTLCDRYSLGFLRNNAVPAAIITTTQFPSDDKRQAFMRNWAGEFGGPDNAGRVALNEVGDDGDGPVGDSIDVKVLGLSAKDARLVEQRKEMTHEIAIALGTPFSKLDASGRTYENADAEDRDWWENTILPELLDLQDDINMQLAPRLGSEVGWFDLRNVRALQRRLFAPLAGSDLPELLDRKVLVPNEVRSELALEPVPWGNEPVEQADPVPAVMPPASPAADPALDPSSDAPPANDPAANTDTPARSEVPAETRSIDLEAVEQRRARVWHSTDALVRSLEVRWERAMGRLFGRQLDATLTRLTGKRGRQAFTRAVGDPQPGPFDAEDIFGLAFWELETRQITQDLYEAVVAAGGQALALRFGVSFDIAAQGVSDFIEARANQLAGNVTQTTYEAIQAALNEGVAAGESIEQLGERIRTLFTQTYANRAVTVARTEVISAYNGASVLGAAQLPSDVVAAQEWIATRDGRTREAHASVDGQLVAIGMNFDVGGEAMAYPGDPAGGASNVVNCRCTVAFLTPEEYTATTGTEPVKVPAAVARTAIRMIETGDAHFDEMRFRRALEVSAA